MKTEQKGMTNPREKVRVGWLPAKLSFLLLFFCLQIQANVYSQQTRVSIKLDNVSVQQLFVEIERITDLAGRAGDSNFDGLFHCLISYGLNINFSN